MHIGFHWAFASCLLAANAAACAAGEALTLSYDHYNPVVLNEFAMQKVREGDIATAVIMLERAAQLAPYDNRIQSNRDVLRAWKTGKPMPSVLPTFSSEQIARPPVKEDEALPPFPLWQNRTIK